ncbi:MAG: hypothetical protein ACYC7A_12920 [Thermoanaerobaculia bacterium]
MNSHSLRNLLFASALLAATAPLSAATAPSPQSRPAPSYRLDLEVSPTAPFPFLKRFGDVDVSVFPKGVRAESSVVDAISRTGSSSVTVTHPVARLYAEVPVHEVRGILVHMGGGKSELFPGLPEFPIEPKAVAGKVRGVDATRYRVVLGKNAWIDIWTTTTIPKNRQFDLLANQLVSAFSKSAAKTMTRIPGVPVFVEVNTSRFKKLVLLRMTQLQRSAQGETEALTVGSFYARAPLVQKLLE